MRIISLCIFCVIIASCSRQSIIHPQRKGIVETVYASGKIISNNEYNVYGLSSGTVIKKLVKEGDSVIKNQVLYIIKNDAPATRLEAAQANYKIAQANLSSQSRILNDLRLSMQSAQAKLSNDSSTYLHLKNLWDENIGTKNNLDAAYTQYILSKNQLQSAHEKYYSTLNDLNLALHSAQSQLTDAQTELNNYFIKSESNGTVFQTYKEPGESVKPNDVVALLGESSNRIIKLAVDQEDIDKIKTGQQVLLKTDITGNTIYHAVVSRLYPLMNEADQTFRVDAVFTDTTQQAFIHSSVEANIIIQKKNNALVIPRAALIADDSVQVKQNGKTKIIAVQTGISTLDETEVIKGLDESSQVIFPAR
jgi:multidrug efflux pump subunit AcrA (membrane-fusion protein)